MQRPAMEAVLGTRALVEKIVGVDFASAAAALAVCRAWRRAASAALKTLNPLAELMERQTATQEALCNDLALSAAAVQRAPCERVSRRYGRVSHVFCTATAVPLLLAQNGGALGLAQRLAARPRRARKRTAEDAVRADRAAEARAKLERGLGALGLQLRADSSMCRELVDSGGKKHALDEVLTTMAHKHWLHAHTNRAYVAAVDAEVESLAEGCADKWGGGYDSFLTESFLECYECCAAIVQAQARFALPTSGLPWLPQYATTAAAIDAAVDAADAAFGAAKRRRVDLAARRAAALAARKEAFATAFAEAYAQTCPPAGDLLRAQGRSAPQPLHVTTADALLATDGGWETCKESELGDFFSDKTLKPKTNLRDVVAFALRLEALEMRRVAFTAARSAAGAAHVKTAADFFRTASAEERDVARDFFSDCALEVPPNVVEETLRVAERVEARMVEAAAQNERLREEARLRKKARERRCTRMLLTGLRCPNQHRARAPTVLHTGPVCGACERLLDPLFEGCAGRGSAKPREVSFSGLLPVLGRGDVFHTFGCV